MSDGRKRGPYNRYLLPNSECSVPARTKRRHARAAEARRLDELRAVADITVDNVNDGRPHEVLGYTAPPFYSNNGQDVNNEDQEMQDGPLQQDLITDFTNQQGITFNISDDSDSESDDNNLPQNTNISNNGTADTNTFNGDTNQEPIDTFAELNDFLKSYGNESNFTVKYSVTDIMLLVLTLSLIHNFSLSAVCDIMKMLNLLLGTSLFPWNQYFFKKLFNPAAGVELHYTCESCGQYLGVKNNDNKAKVRTCINCNYESRTDGYRYDYAFVTLDVGSQILELLNNPSCEFVFNYNEESSPVLNDINCGELYSNNVPYSYCENYKYITCTWNSDGSPVSKDGKTTITPIYLMLNEIDYKVRGKYLVLAGLWYGKEKPVMEVFLKPFVEQMNKLRNTGFTVLYKNQMTKFKVLTLCCCVDTVARAPMQGIKGVNGYFCCSWCELEGTYVDDTNVKYPSEYPEPEDRTDQRFKACVKKLEEGNKNECELKGITSSSSLLQLLSFSIVWGFVPDFMHLICLGVTRRILNLWLTKVGEDFYIGTPKHISKFDGIISKIKVPSYLKRLPTLLSNRKIMKSKELENWFFFFSCPVLKGNLPRKYYNHWKSLVQAVRCLMQDEITMDEIDNCESALIDFVKKAEDYYGAFEITYNMHQLVHLAESVRKWGPLWAHTAYPFESSLGTLKTIIKASKGIPHQIVRNIEVNRACTLLANNYSINEHVLKLCVEIEDCRLVKAVSTDRNEILFGKTGEFEENIYGLPENVELIEYQKVIKDSVVYWNETVAENIKNDNSYVEFYDGTFAKIINIVAVHNNPQMCYLVVKKLILDHEPFLTFTKRIIGMCPKEACTFTAVKCVAVHILVDRENEYISSIPVKHYAMNL